MTSGGVGPVVIGASKWELDTPALIVDLDVLQRNIDSMIATFRTAGVNWRPHAKAHKIPAIAQMQIASGAIGITCAKVSEAEVMANAGIKDILIANEIVGAAKIGRLLNLRHQADVIVAVDSETNVLELNDAFGGTGLRLRVVVEVDNGMHRCGVAPGEPALALARVVSQCDGLLFAGLMAYEAHTATIANQEEKRLAIEAAVGELVRSANLCRSAGLPVQIVSCGGTGTYRVAAFVPGVTEIQAGGGIFSDIVYRTLMALDHDYALTLIATVISRPTPTRIVCDAGRKSMSRDSATPVPTGLGAVQSLALSAEHATIELSEPNHAIRIGHKVEFVVGYSDTTVHLHEELYGVRAGRVETVWPVLGRGKVR